MFGAIKYHFAHLADFTGRDARQTFWFWFLFLFIANIAISMVASVPMMAEAVAIGVEAARSGKGEAADAQMLARLGDHMDRLILVSIALGVANVVLMAAAFVRRLHDSGKSGVWALIAGAIYLASLYLAWARADEAAALMVQMQAAGDPAAMLEAQSQLAWHRLLGYVPIIMIIVFGLLKSDPDANRYGAEPVRF